MDDDRYSACPEQEPALEALLFGELSGADRGALEDHLEGCERCRSALADARRAAAGLEALGEPPLPYPSVTTGGGETTAEWTEFKRRLAPRRRWQPLAAAALLLVGVGLGRWLLPGHGSDAPPVGVTAETAGVGAEAVDALARAEVLTDLGIPYMEGLQGIMTRVLDMHMEEVDEQSLAAVREQARMLVSDGRALRRLLDEEQDGEFLAAVWRAELYLEEIAALDRLAGAETLTLVQRELRGSGLADRLASVDVQGAARTALQASGWIGQESTIETGGRP
jgi:hypothetical protein